MKILKSPIQGIAEKLNIDFRFPENLKNNDKDLVKTVIMLAVCHDIIIDEKKGV